MSLAEQFPEITQRDQPLAPYTHLKIGGPAQYLVQPRTLEELNAVLAACRQEKLQVRMLGGGFNLLVRDDPIPGVVIRLTAEPFTFLKRDGRRIVAGGGGQLFDLIAFAVRAGLGGLETLIGIRGTVGGSVRCNVGDRTAEISQTIRNVTVLTEAGTVQVRNRDELTFREHASDIDEPVILAVEFEL
jgi:UDP-N-acetylmuramate dehydrogenase